MPAVRLVIAPNEPHVELRNWRAFLLLVPALGEIPLIHLVGVSQLSGRVRVSSPVTALTEPTELKNVHDLPRRAMTRSGRTYDLVGEPGRLEDCVAVLDGWVQQWDASVLGDVTNELFTHARPVAHAGESPAVVLH